MQDSVVTAQIIPEPKESFDLTAADGAVIRIRRHGNANGLRLVLCHGNGFAIDAYLPFWQQLTTRYDVVLYDQRNHGQNPRHKVDCHDLPNFVSDMEDVFWAIGARFGLSPTVGVFHSISGVTSVWHALKYGKRWDGLVLFDPAFIPGVGLPEHEVARNFELMLVKWSRTRPSRFANPIELATKFANSRSLRRWVPGGHDLMARCILRRLEQTGEWELCCPPEGESQVYLTNSRTHLTHRFNEISVPVKLICADPDQNDAQAPSKVGRSLHAQFSCPYEAIRDTSHMLQIEKPTECVQALVSFLEELKIDR